jgi:hypothetical protein
MNVCSVLQVLDIPIVFLDRKVYLSTIRTLSRLKYSANSYFDNGLIQSLTVTSLILRICCRP